MKKKFLSKQKSFVFRKWKNKSWAAFVSLGKAVKIASLSAVYFAFSQFEAKAQQDTIRVDEVQIESMRTPTLFTETARIVQVIPRGEIEKMPVQSLPDLLENLCGIDVRGRGTQGVQADVSVRGGTFEQTLILINGVKLNDSQTGHHNMDLPVDLENIERIEILEGPGNRVFGTNSYSGAINIITKTEADRSLKFAAFGGEHDYYGMNLTGNFNIGRFSNSASVSQKKSGGYLENSAINNTDFDVLTLFYQAALNLNIAKFDFQAGYADKSFGANSFYTPKYPWQFEQTKTSFGNLKISTGNRVKLAANLYLRNHSDRFELFRESKYQRTGNYFADGTDTAKYVPGVYAAWNYYAGHNYHLTHTYGGESKLNFVSKLGKTAVGAEYRYEQIFSNVLGDILDTPIDVPNEPFGLFTKSKVRQNVNLYAEHVVEIGKFIASGGYSANYNDQFDWNFSGGGDLAFNLSKFVHFFASANQAVRLPSFTDLYYSGASNLGNPDLKPEKAWTFEAGTKLFYQGFSAHIAVFERFGKNTIDWVKQTSADLKWQTQNITELTTVGAECSGKYQFEKSFFIQNISFSYSYIDQTKQSGDYISYYALDYLKHKATAGLQHKIYGKFGASWQMNYQDRAGTYSVFDRPTNTFTGETEYKPYFIADGKLFWQSAMLEFYVEASNIFNTKYEDLANIEMPGQWIRMGVKLNLNFSKK